ncbi:energy transducer TonB [Hymenobacter cheonanensis]|uniref:energy transducer TonB n=1 Tax=Hymenobacter sp. CA2-7 TaxID=3063993 RepID=UPI002712A262|nr:energy transducer TonB [Hymenobacter sp. CA2-7]MDO7886181.1 TonB family protein [Hymenobacter sp. CA2-7]
MMDNAQLANASLNDIVFEGRNKTYGAFELRRIYGRNVTRALIIGAALLALLVFIPAIAKMLEDRKPKEVLNLKENVLMDAPPLDETKPPPPPPPPEAPPPPPPKLTTVKFTPPVVKKDEEVKKEEVPDQEELKDKTVATVSVKGNTDAPDLSDLSGEGTKPVEEVVETNKVYTYVEQMPALPGGGGMGAIVAAIQKNVRYPAVDLRNQVEGRVFASFTVDENGDISDVKIVKGLSGTIDAETIRSIKALPKFIPGKQNGRSVKVSFTVPVTYKIQ